MNICGFEAGLDQPLFLIAGPCVVENLDLAQTTAGQLKAIADKNHMAFIYKSSFDKANRTSAGSFRGPGIERGLQILQAVKKEFAVPVLTDVHEDTPIDEVAEVVDVLQTPAFLCRQTNYIQRVRLGRPAGQYQKRPVSVALGHAPCGAKSARRRQ